MGPLATSASRFADALCTRSTKRLTPLVDVAVGPTATMMVTMTQRSSLLLVILLFRAMLLAQVDVGRVIPADRPVHLVAFGAFGTGDAHQKAVASAIARRNSRDRFDLGITMGDNFYLCGVRSITDPKWKSRWEDPYTALQFPFYAALGNHDCGHPPIICPMERGSPDAEVAYTTHSASWRMPARYYAYKAGPVQFIAIDTEGWSDAQLDWIQQTLAASANDPDIKWRVVYGHHPIYTSGVHLNERRIGELRAPSFAGPESGSRRCLYLRPRSRRGTSALGRHGVPDLRRRRREASRLLAQGSAFGFYRVGAFLSGHNHRQSQVHGAVPGRESKVA